MSNFTPSKKEASDFNGGVEYVDGVDDETGDVVHAESINSVIEGLLYTQGLAANAPDISEANQVGTVEVSIVTYSDGTARLKFKNLKGKQGVGISTIVANGVDANGGNIYKITLDDGRTYNFVAPKGAKGDTGNGVSTAVTTYTTSTSGTTAPSIGWQSTIPTVAQGNYLWTRTVTTYTNGTSNTSYTSAYQGQDGQGAVISVNGETGDVTITPADIGAAAEEALTDGSVTKVGTSTKGSSTKPIYLSSGTPTECSRTIPSITLNGSSNTSPSFYAPTSAGTNGYLSKSNGSGAPSWASHGSYSGSGLTSHAGVADYVKEYYHTTSGSAWYRIWASGWKEMGGLIAGDSSNPATHIISLPAPFTTTNYAVFFSVIKENTNVTMEVGQIFNRTKSQMTVQILYRNASSSGYASEACLWYACGY